MCICKSKEVFFIVVYKLEGMKKTLTQKKRETPQKKQAALLWKQVEIYFNYTKEYTKKKEYLSAYYNLLLASVCCKHYVECLHITLPDETDLQTNDSHPQKCLQKDKPLESVLYLYELVPKYKKKLEAFQEAFGCPKAYTASTSSPPDKRNYALNSVDEDCDVVQQIDLSTEEQPIRFSDLIGNTIAKQSIYDGLLYPVFMPLMYPQQSRAILFYGPPGTGKTMLAKATAHELNRYSDSTLRVLFYAPTADQFKGKYVGETEEKIVRIFRCASQHADKEERRLNANSTTNVNEANDSKIRVQSVIFIDELDSLARRRDNATGSGASIVASATNTLLQTMDGMQSVDNVIVMGATNYPWNIDNAVLRRFGQKIYVPLPDEENIVEMLQQNINQRVLHGLFSLDNTNLCISNTPNPKTVYEQFRSYTNQREQFLRTFKLHGIREDDLKVIASEMMSTHSHAGFSPRDILRVCADFFKKESTHALQRDIFYNIQLQPRYQSHEEHTENNEMLLRAVENKYVSEATFKHLNQQFGYAMDSEATYIKLQEDHQYPLAITETTIPNSVESAQPQKTQQKKYTRNKSLLKQTNQEIFHAFHIYWGDTDHETFLLHRSFKMFVRKQTHYIPFFLKGTFQQQKETKQHKSNSNTTHESTNTGQPPSTKELLKHVTHMNIVYDGRLYELPFQSSHSIHESHWTNIETNTILLDTTKGWLSQWTSYLSLPFSSTSSQPYNNISNDIKSIVDYVVNVKGNYISPSEITTQTRFSYETQSHATPPCTHITYNIQHLLDQLRLTQSSATIKNIKELETYQQTGKEP